MTEVISRIWTGRFCNQLIRSIATSIVAQRHNLKVSYAISKELRLLGLELFSGRRYFFYTRVEFNRGLIKCV